MLQDKSMHISEAKRLDLVWDLMKGWVGTRYSTSPNRVCAPDSEVESCTKDAIRIVDKFLSVMDIAVKSDEEDIFG